MLTDPNFVDSLRTFVVFAAFIVPSTFALSLATAVLVARTRVAQAFFRSVFFLPTACSYVVASLIWKMSIFNGVPFGLANSVLSAVGGGDDPVAVDHVDRPGTGWSSSPRGCGCRSAST